MIDTLTLWTAFNDAGVPWSVVDWARERWPGRIETGLMVYEQWFYPPKMTVSERQLSSVDIQRVEEQWFALPAVRKQQIARIDIDIELGGFWWRACDANDFANIFPETMARTARWVRSLTGRKIGWYGIPTLINWTNNASSNRTREQSIMLHSLVDEIHPSVYVDGRKPEQDWKVLHIPTLLYRGDARSFPKPLPVIPIMSVWRTHDKSNIPLTAEQFMRYQVEPVIRADIEHASLWDSNDWPVHATNTAAARCRALIEAVASRNNW